MLFIFFTTFAPLKNKKMKNTLLISLLTIGSAVVAQETTTIDTLQELPREEAVISKTLQLERILSKNWELDRED